MHKILYATSLRIQRFIYIFVGATPYMERIQMINQCNPIHFMFHGSDDFYILRIYTSESKRIKCQTLTSESNSHDVVSLSSISIKPSFIFYNLIHFQIETSIALILVCFEWAISSWMSFRRLVHSYLELLVTCYRPITRPGRRVLRYAWPID